VEARAPGFDYLSVGRDTHFTGMSRPTSVQTEAQVTTHTPNANPNGCTILAFGSMQPPGRHCVCPPNRARTSDTSSGLGPNLIRSNQLDD